MYLSFNSTEYTGIENLSFSVTAGLDGLSIPANSFTVDVMGLPTDALGEMVLLYQESKDVFPGHAQLWARYYVTEVDLVGRGFTRIKAESKVSFLDSVEMAEAMYDGENALFVLRSLDRSIGSNWDFDIDSSLMYMPIKGYFPKQSARERLLWLCLAVNGWVKDFGNRRPEILPVPERVDPVDIPVNRTFWRPKVGIRQGVTRVAQKVYTYERREPEQGERYVEVYGSKYVYTVGTVSQEVTADYVKTVEINDVSIRGDAIFGPMRVLRTRHGDEVEVSVVNNGDYWPGDFVKIHMDDGGSYSGFVESCDFSFGLQARSRMLLQGAWKND